ncbi:hypothetical protein Acy02nite_80170 [Actinoplanes cyaneus]|uniref:Uncharacterized protein n=1 Tax=Actinoplanes cyaneus TaxID=52696 RepID=A0A919ISB3_9ACTN|nr:hypothetical protein [Actinoplanes cyaneus]MCW2140790.1 hypothetical protein [Actinoplanes cyaneus]GID70136.1 hypothetical protein Acy02nite_80170 [Actinoplanes cyaneus]
MAGRAPARVLDTVVVIAAAVPALTLLAVIWLAVPALPPLPLGVVVLGALPGIALLITSDRLAKGLSKRGIDGRPLVAEHWRAVLTAAAAMLAVLAIVVITVKATGTVNWPAGQPTETGGRYYLNVHGGLLPVTEPEYRQALKSSVLIFLSGGLVLELAALARLGLMGKKLNP